MDGKKNERPARHQRDQRQSGDRNMDRQNVGHRLLKIIEDAASELDRLDDRSEIILQQHQRGGRQRLAPAAARSGARRRLQPARREDGEEVPQRTPSVGQVARG